MRRTRVIPNRRRAMPSMKTAIKYNYVCAECGSDRILNDAWAYWDVEKQSFEIHSTQDMTYCENCDGECRVNEVTA